MRSYVPSKCTISALVEGICDGDYILEICLAFEPSLLRYETSRRGPPFLVVQTEYHVIRLIYFSMHQAMFS